MNNHEKLKEFYNYKYWREIQRNQLGVSANLHFVFSSAIYGFILNLLIEKNCCLSNCEKFIFIISLIFQTFSLFFYGLFTQNRLKDSQATAKLIYEEKPFVEIRNSTLETGKKTWKYYYCQRNLLIVGLIISLIGFSIYIF